MKKSRNFDRLSEHESLPLLKFNLMISISAKMLYQEVMENSPRSGRSHGKVRKSES